MKLHTINTGFFKLDGGAFFGVVPKMIWNSQYPSDEKNLCTWAMRCLLVELNYRLILIDCGMGNKQDAKFFRYYEPSGEDNLERSLNLGGFEPEDITDVFLTHLHFDHCGGAIVRDKENNLVPAFKNANYWSNVPHWEWAIKPNSRERPSFLKENILPIQQSGQLRFVEDDSKELFPGFRVKFVNGHTEAMMLPVLDYNGKTVVYCADLIPSAGHIPLAYVMAYDVRPLITMEEKEVFLNEAAEKNYILYFEHDPKIEACTVLNTERGIRLKETLHISEV
jgi:glyoxylase-like metal-dependent hydrolase (beta-lactamase superfamily II)